MALLEVKNLRVAFRTRRGNVRAVDGVSFALNEGETLAIVGESGSGKSVTAMSVLRLIDENGYIEDGEIAFDGLDLAKLPIERMYSIRGNRISMIFQEPMTALNPVLSIGKQLVEPFCVHRGMKKRAAWAEGVKLLEEVRIPNPERVMKNYPHQLSGGMRQRVMIAMALALEPDILVADEPTTALDVTIQAQILRLIKELQEARRTAVLFITHDLGVVREIADNVAVVYCGQVVERVPAPVLFGESVHSHPYTEALIASAPSGKNAGKRLESIPGSVPALHELPKGCRFAPRCAYCTRKCTEELPALVEVERGQLVRCFYPTKKERKSVKHRSLIVRQKS